MANDDFTQEEKDAFALLGVSDSDVGLKNLIRAQRQLNGSLCKALWSVVDALQNEIEGKDPAGKGRSLNDAIKRARFLIEEVAREPPGCNPKDPRT